MLFNRWSGRSRTSKVPSSGHKERWELSSARPPVHVDKSSVICGSLQAKSARLIGEAVQQNPAFLTLRRIEVCT